MENIAEGRSCQLRHLSGPADAGKQFHFPHESRDLPVGIPGMALAHLFEQTSRGSHAGLPAPLLLLLRLDSRAFSAVHLPGIGQLEVVGVRVWRLLTALRRAFIGSSPLFRVAVVRLLHVLHS